MTELLDKPKNLSHRGGRREGAGRPQGSGRYGEPTKAMRIPQSLVNSLQQFLAEYNPAEGVDFSAFAFKNKIVPLNQPLPFYEQKIAAGFPSPVDDYIETALDLSQHLVKNPATTFYVRAQGDSMINCGIYSNDLLMVDRSLTPQNGSVIIASVNNEFTVKRLRLEKNNQVSLMPENENYTPIHVTEEIEFRIWGVVTNVIHALAQ